MPDTRLPAELYPNYTTIQFVIPSPPHHHPQFGQAAAALAPGYSPLGVPVRPRYLHDRGPPSSRPSGWSPIMPWWFLSRTVPWSRSMAGVLRALEEMEVRVEMRELVAWLF
ncbi:hypothetical protein MLD38_038423 [Melastoma candidum]|uniref:Uncharacterized protein n=1 Tax=Melastoma candidum TaxID=119954 RepID=A0ACB9L0B7_9MYRT|nr:hypothetical protein MLD38_038423 [Melastoma candidum]